MKERAKNCYGSTFLELLPLVAEDFNSMLRMNIYEDAMGRKEAAVRIRHKKELRRALRSCTCGDKRAKRYVKESIKELLLKEYHVDDEWMERLLPLWDAGRMTAEEQFAVLMYAYRQRYGEGAFEVLAEESGLFYTTEEGRIYEMSGREILELYRHFSCGRLTFPDKLEIISQRIYERLKGNGVVDELLEMKIDGVSGGVSGHLAEMQEYLELGGESRMQYDSVWVMYQGLSVHLSFLGFGSEKELRRVCRNVCRYHQMGQLSEKKGFLVTELQDGSRVSVARPPFSEGWVFFVRRFRSGMEADLDQLITDEGAWLIKSLLGWLVKGGCQLGITGEQGAGKTTLLAAMVRFLPPGANIRVQELAFELHLRRLYPDRNIVSFRQTDSTSAQEGLEFQKKTDGSVAVLGEVATMQAAQHLVQTSQNASGCTLFTHHAKSTLDLAAYLRNALLMEGGFREERIAAEQAIRSVQFDIHLRKDRDGRRYIERITELVPGNGKDRMFLDELLWTRDIAVMEQGRYQRGKKMSREVLGQIRGRLTGAERLDFEKEMEEWG